MSVSFNYNYDGNNVKINSNVYIKMNKSHRNENGAFDIILIFILPLLKEAFSYRAFAIGEIH